MKTRFFLLAAALLFCAATAHAHDYTLHYSHFARLAVPAEAQGKTVVAAEARVGIMATKLHLPGEPWMPWKPYWAAERTVSLDACGDHFFAKVRLDAIQAPGGYSLGAVMVQFTLTFEDGSTLVLRETSLPAEATHNTSSSKDYSEALALEGERFLACDDATESSVASVSYFYSGFPLF